MRLTIKQIKFRIDMLKGYLERKGIYPHQDWPPPNKDYWPNRWHVEYYLMLKDEYYKRLAKNKKRLSKLKNT